MELFQRRKMLESYLELRYSDNLFAYHMYFRRPNITNNFPQDTTARLQISRRLDN